MTARALIVGQAPSQDTDGRPPFTGRSGARLADLLHVEHRRLAATVDLVNLLPAWPGRNRDGRGDRFPMPEARAAAAMLLAVAPHDRVVACGRLVADALGLGRPAPLARTWLGRHLCLYLPHPSGLCHWWNDEDHRESAGIVLRAFVAADLHAVR